MAGERQEYPILPAAGWDVLTPVYDVLCSAVGLGKGFKRWLIELANVEPQDRVLDVGCGTGTLAVLLAVTFPATQISAVDPDPRAVDIARRKARKIGAQLDFCNARAESIPFADASFDKVFSTLMLHHIPDDQKLAVLREIHRTLRPGGRLILADFESSASWLFWGKDRSRQKLERWLSDAGFEIARLGYRRGVHVFKCAALAQSRTASLRDDDALVVTCRKTRRMEPMRLESMAAFLPHILAERPLSVERWKLAMLGFELPQEFRFEVLRVVSDYEPETKPGVRIGETCLHC